MKWYVLHVRTGKEDAIRRELLRQDYTAAAPSKIMAERHEGRWRGKLKTVLPGYVFVRLDLTDEDYYRITSVPGVIRFLGSECPEPLHDDEEAFVLWLDNQGVPLESSTIRVSEGNPAEIISGPLRGREGLIVWLARRQRRACVAITVAGNRKEFTLSMDVLRAPDAAQTT